MLIALILIVVCWLLCRLVLPFAIISTAGTITNNHKSVEANRQNITASRNGDYRGSVLHLFEKLMIYSTALCLSIFLLFPEISVVMILIAMLLIVLQIAICCSSIKDENAYTWIFLRNGSGNKHISGRVYSNNINNRVSNNFSRFKSQELVNKQIITNDRNIQRNQSDLMRGEIGVNGRRPADGTVQGYKVWRVNSSKECCITEKGRIIYKNNDGYLSSVDCKNISDDKAMVIFELSGNESIVSDVANSANILPMMQVSKSGKVLKKLYVDGNGACLETPFSEMACSVVNSINGRIQIKMPEENYYIAENNTEDGIVLSELVKNSAGYEFNTFENSKIVKYVVDSNFELMSSDSEVNEIKSGSARKSIEKKREEIKKVTDNLKSTIDKLPTRTALSMSIKNLVGIKLAGLGNDGVYNNGVVDMMCEFGELMVIEQGSITPTVQAILLTKLLPAAEINDVLNRIGDNWTDSTIGEMFDDVCITLKNVVECKLSQCVNYWFTDDKDVYYMSVVLNGKVEANNDIYSQLYSMCIKMCLRNGLQQDKEIGYRCSIYEADESKFLDLIPDSQRYFYINKINITPRLFDKYLSDVPDQKLYFKEVADRSGVLFKGTIIGVKRYTPVYGTPFGYCCSCTIPKSFIEDWIKSETVKKVKIKSSISTPAKIRDVLINSLDMRFLINFNPIVAIAYENTNGDSDVNFLFSSDNSMDSIINHVFTTPLVTYACYDRLNRYRLDPNRDVDMSILLFVRKVNKNEN